MPDTTSKSLSEAEILAVAATALGRRPYTYEVAFAEALLAKQREMDAKAEPDAWLHKYRRTWGGESYEMADLAEPKSPPEPRENFKWIGADPLFLHPPAAQDREPMTDAMVLRAARELCKIHAGECQVNEQDTWNIYADQFKRDARAALEAAHGIKEPQR